MMTSLLFFSCLQYTLTYTILNLNSQEHIGCEKIICPLCLKLFSKNEHKSISKFFYSHIVNHFALSSVNSCPNCTLLFNSKKGLRRHLLKGHSNPLKSESGKHNVFFSLFLFHNL